MKKIFVLLLLATLLLAGCTQAKATKGKKVVVICPDSSKTDDFRKCPGYVEGVGEITGELDGQAQAPVAEEATAKPAQAAAKTPSPAEAEADDLPPPPPPS